MGDDGGMKSAFCDCNHPFAAFASAPALCGWLVLVRVRRFLFPCSFARSLGQARVFCPLASSLALAWAGGGRRELFARWHRP